MDILCVGGRKKTIMGTIWYITRVHNFYEKSWWLVWSVAIELGNFLMDEFYMLWLKLVDLIT